MDSADVAAACAQCLASYEGALDSAQQQLARQTAAAEAQQAEAAAAAARLEGGLRALLGALETGLPGLPLAAARETLLDGSTHSSSNSATAAATAAVQQVAQAVQERVEQAEAAAVHAALLALEAQLLPAPPTSSAPPSPRKLLSPTKRQQAAEAPAAPPSMEANEQRLEGLLTRAQGLLGQLASSEAAVAQLRQQVAALEAAALEASARFAQVGSSSGWHRVHKNLHLHRGHF